MSAKSLERDLRHAMRGAVWFHDGARALYATDASNYRKVPIGVVAPVDPEDTAAALRVCADHRVPVLPRGSGTSLAGQSCNTAVILDFTRHQRRILDLDPASRTARVEPGVPLDDLRNAAHPHGLTFAPDPSTHGWCTLGGMIGNNSCGVHSVQGGRTSDNVHRLRIFTADDATELDVGAYPGGEIPEGRLGQIVRELRALADEIGDLVRKRYPRIPRRVSGYNLDQLLPESGFHVARSLVGSEGTCAVVTEATLRLVPWARHRVLLVLGYPDVYEAADHVPQVLEAGPQGLEGIDAELVRGMKAKRFHLDDLGVLPDGCGWLMAEFGGDTVDEARAKAEALQQRVKVPSRILVDPEQQRRLWEIREAGLPATARVPGRPDTWEGWEDSAVPPAALGDYLRDLRALFRRYGYRASTYGHFGDGCVHTRIPFGLRDDAGIAQFRRFVEDASDLVLEYGGSFSGEHGDGQAKAELLGKLFGPEILDAFRRFKRIWDPEWRMNPGRVVDPDPMTSNLRVADVVPYRPRTVFRYPDDHGSLQYATERCVGIGKCRKLEGGTMCPSYRATLDEHHSTRGRAHLLYEMLRPDSPVASARMQSLAVKEALDLCLACKGCKGDCPMGVDVATYKAEFDHRWYRWRLRPRIAWIFGLMPWIAPALSRIARLVNWLAGRRWVRKLLGVHPDRPIPPLAAPTFRRSAPALPRDGEPVLLWVDSWTEHFHPEVGRAAVEVLRRTGFAVTLSAPACCGRPLYDHGMLGLARRALRRSLDAVRDAVDRGWPVVILEPSCASVFRDELPNLFPDDPAAKALTDAVVTLGGLLDQRRPELVAHLDRKVLYHAHCHHKAVLDTHPDEAVLRRIGAELTPLDVGCCGMSGIFGYARDKYEVSVRVGETGVLPAVRSFDDQGIVCADGFSCRTQIADLADRRALHLAEILLDALPERT